MSDHEHISVDPWIHERENRRPVPNDAAVVCRWWLDCGLADIHEKLHFRRDSGRDELWVSANEHTGRIAVDRARGRSMAACRRLVDALVRSRVGFGWPTSVTAGELLSEDEAKGLIDAIETELDENARRAREQESAIVETARELGLVPEPTGTGGSSWRARCPGTQHGIWMDAATDTFGCGYCRVKGGPAELRAFAEKRRGRS